MTYGWTWYLPEDDPDERGTAWISIEPLEIDGDMEVMSGDEIAVIMCRNYDQVKVEHPDWIANDEKNAELICSALNLREEVLERRAEGFEFPPSTMELLEGDENE